MSPPFENVPANENAGAGEDSLRMHYSALRGALATEQSDAKATRLLLLARVEARAEQSRERRRSIVTAMVALGCALFVGIPGAWALSNRLAPARSEAPTVLPSLPQPAPAGQGDTPAATLGAARAATPRAALRRRRPSVTSMVAAAPSAVGAEVSPPSEPAENSETAPNEGEPTLLDPVTVPAASAEPSVQQPENLAVDRAPPASYTRAVDLVRRMRDAEAEPLLRAVIADARSAHWRREASRMLELLLARRGAEPTPATALSH